MVDMLLMEVAAVGAEGAADGAVGRATDEVTALYKACRQQSAQECYSIWCVCQRKLTTCQLKAAVRVIYCFKCQQLKELE